MAVWKAVGKPDGSALMDRSARMKPPLVDEMPVDRAGGKRNQAVGRTGFDHSVAVRRSRACKARCPWRDRADEKRSDRGDGRTGRQRGGKMTKRRWRGRALQPIGKASGRKDDREGEPMSWRRNDMAACRMDRRMPVYKADGMTLPQHDKGDEKMGEKGKQKRGDRRTIYMAVCRTNRWLPPDKAVGWFGRWAWTAVYKACESVCCRVWVSPVCPPGRACWELRKSAGGKGGEGGSCDQCILRE